MAGGHPRETLEASFDVVQDDHSKSYLGEAETIVVALQVMALLPRVNVSFFTFKAKTPLWYLRINHTRLTDCIMDLCGVPAKESTRLVALQILTTFTAPSPYLLAQSLLAKKKVTFGRKSFDEKDRPAQLSALLKEAVTSHGMSEAAAGRLRAFVESCMPLPPDVGQCIERLKKAVAMIQGVDSGSTAPRRAKRLEDAAKSLKALKDLFLVLESLDLEPLITGRTNRLSDASISLPLFVSLDLGLRQRRKHYHGGVIFQCIALPEAYFDRLDPDENNEMLISAAGRGVKVAEGGNFSELVRKFRPPGNFATAFVNYYTAAPIPVCVGVRFSIGKLVELLYLDAASSNRRSSTDTWNELAQMSSMNKQTVDLMRQSLGHPLQYAESVTAVVASVHGMDSASTRERFVVACRLWAEGISAEYLPQSGIMLSLLKRLREDPDDTSGASDWSLMELFGVCTVLNIPYVVMVQPHLLKDKGSVRLRRFPYDITTQGPTSNEMVVALDDLANVIRGDSAVMEEDSEEGGEVAVESTRDSRSSTSRVECIYVDHDAYFGNDRDVSKNETPQWKSYLKAMKSVSMSAEAYLSSLQDSKAAGVPVFAVADATFWALREFGTALMRRERQEQSAMGAANETTERYPKHKRVLKTLATAIDNYVRRHGHEATRGGSNLLTILLYSRVDDRFDMVTLEGHANGHSAKRK